MEEERVGRRMLFVAWLLFFGLLFAFFYFYERPAKNNWQIQKGSIVIKADKQGHYMIDGNINGQAVSFIIDTGATLVAIPENVAEKLGLRRLYPITVKTANGEVTGSLTRIDTLIFGQFTLHDVKAIIGPASGDRMVLLGMNVLSQFTITQQDHRLEIKH